MTIRDLFEQVTVQGLLEVKIMGGDNAVTVWRNNTPDEFNYVPHGLNKYVDNEIGYIYPGDGTIVIEVEKED